MLTAKYYNCFEYGITMILRFFYGFFSGYNKNTMQGRIFFFWVWVFLWGLGMANFVTHFLILIVKVHKMSRIYIQVSSSDYYTFRFLKVLYLHSCNIKKK